MTRITIIELGHPNSPYRLNMADGDTIPLTKEGFERAMEAFETGVVWVQFQPPDGGKKCVVLRHLVSWRCP